jgi:hypothetical protein
MLLVVGVGLILIGLGYLILPLSELISRKVAKKTAIMALSFGVMFVLLWLIWAVQPVRFNINISNEQIAATPVDNHRIILNVDGVFQLTGENPKCPNFLVLKVKANCQGQPAIFHADHSVHIKVIIDGKEYWITRVIFEPTNKEDTLKHIRPML